MTAAEAKDVHPLRFVLDRVLKDDAPYRPNEALVLIVIARTMAFDGAIGEFCSFLSYARIRKRTRLSVRTIQGVLEHHCEQSPAPLVARSFAKATRGHVHRSYRWTLVLSPEAFAIQRDLRAKRAKRAPSGAAAQRSPKSSGLAAPTPIVQSRAGQTASYRTYTCACGVLVTEYADNRGVIEFVSDVPHVCPRADRQDLHTSDRQDLPTNTCEPVSASEVLPS